MMRHWRESPVTDFTKGMVSLKKRIGFALALLIMLSLFSGCKANMEKSQSIAYTTGADSNSYRYEALDQYTDDDYKVNESSAVRGENNTTAIEKKIIRNASVSMVSDDAEKLYSEILKEAKLNSGYEFSKSVNRDSYNVYIEATIQIVPEKLDDFLAAINGLGEITDINIESDDITSQYYDVETRIKTMEKTLEQYYKLMEDAQDINSVLMIQERIDQLTMELESLKGQLRYYDSEVNESTVDIMIVQDIEQIEEIEEFDWDSLSFEDCLKLAKNGLLAVTNFIYSLFQWFIIILVACMPLIIIAAIIVVVIKLAIRAKRRKKSKADLQEKN